MRWVLTIRGRTIPINPEPDPSGNLIFVTTSSGVRVQACTRVTLAALPAREPRYLAHAATCERKVAERRNRPRSGVAS